MPVVSAQHLAKSYGERTLLRDVTFTIRTGERVGLVGRNGTGKSTLARVIAGLEPKDAGEIAVRRGASIAYLEQMPQFAPERSPRELVSEGLSHWLAARRRYDELAERVASDPSLVTAQGEAAAEVERLGGWDRSHEILSMLGHLGVARIDDPIGTMSGGEQRRVALARILVSRPTLAILDEPTNHLDVDTIDWLERYLADEYPGALLLVTHDRYLLDRLCSRTWELDHGELYSYDGGYETYLEAKAERLLHEERTEANRQNFLRRELEWLARQPKARTTKQKARIERAETAQAVSVRPADKTASLQITETRAGGTIVDIESLRVDVAGRTLVSDLTLHLTAGERIGVVGPNGTGKTSLLRALTGELAPAGGRITVGKNTKVAYFDQGRSGLDPDKSIYENIADQGNIQAFGQTLDPRSYLERFLFEARDQRAQVRGLSGGERARVALAKALRLPANLVLLDEPTNDLDVATLGALEEMLLSFAGSALVVTHDRWFLDRVATSILVFEGEGRVVRYPGNYETYRRLRAEKAEEEKIEAKPTESKPPAAAKPKSKGLTYAQRLELEKLPERIEEADARVREWEQKASDPALYRADPDAMKQTLASLEAARAEAASLMARWEELETLGSA